MADATFTAAPRLPRRRQGSGEMRRVLEREQVIARPRAEVFAFFASAANLERLTPSTLHFEIRSGLDRPISSGAVIDYRLSLLGVAFSWRTLIEVFDPPLRFVDVQQHGPYASWRHTHDFSDVPGGTLVRDRVEYELPLGALGAVLGGWLVKRQLRQIFDFRRDALAGIFGAGGPDDW